jgi:hypothetical protein
MTRIKRMIGTLKHQKAEKLKCGRCYFRVSALESPAIAAHPLRQPFSFCLPPHPSYPRNPRSNFRISQFASPSGAGWESASEVPGSGVDVGARVAVGVDAWVAAGVGESAGGSLTAQQE